MFRNKSKGVFTGIDRMNRMFRENSRILLFILFMPVSFLFP